MKRMGAVHTSKFRRKVKKIKIALAGIKLSSHRDNFNKGRRFTKRLVFKKNRRIYRIRVKSRYRFNVPNRLTARLHYRFKVARYVRKAKVYTCIYKSFTRKFSKIRPVYFKFRQRLMCKRRSFRP